MSEQTNTNAETGIMYAPEGWESGLHHDIEDAVRVYVEGVDETLPIAELIERATWPVQIQRFRHLKVTDAWIDGEADRLCERMLDSWHEDFGNTDDDSPEPTTKMIRQMRAFVGESLAALCVWQCEECGTVTVTKEEAKAMLEGEV
jgi:hypothetical protein